MPRWEDIVAMVDRRELDTQDMRMRMDDDYAKYWRMDEHWEPTGYRRYTTAEPRIYAKKMIATLAASVMALKIPQEGDPMQQRMLNNRKEQFLLGGFKQNDERLARMDEPSLRAQISWYAPIRGRTVGRCLLVRRQDGSAYMDATPWDPRHVMWEMGPDGLEWICHKYTRSPEYIKRTYNVEMVVEPGASKPREDNLIYDFYDRTRNQVVVPNIRRQNKMVKNERHGLLDRVPAWISSSNLQPPVISGPVFERSGSFQMMMNEYGESIFAEDRRVWETHNEVMSIMLELVARARKPLMLVKSPTGSRILEYDPYKEGATLSLRNDEDIVVPNLLAASPDTGAFLAIIAGEMQRGALPPIMFGDSPLAISGFAMNTLRGSIQDKILPLIESQTNALQQICDIWSDHFSFGDFDGIELSGRGNNREWFDAFITPDEIIDLPRPEIKLVPVVPQDDAAKMNMAQLARQPGVNGFPLYADRYIHEDIMDDQDADLTMAQVIEQVAAGMNPFAMLDTIIESLVRVGDMTKAQYYLSDKMELLQQKQLAAQGMAQPQLTPQPGGTGGNSNGNGSGGGLPPQVAPGPVQGNPQPTPTPQAGPLVPPGTPRPGAQGNSR